MDKYAKIRLTVSASITGVLLLVAVAAVGNSNIQTANAQPLDKDNGASSYAPRERQEPSSGGWMPMERPPTCEGCAEDNPGQQGIEDDTIGCNSLKCAKE